MTDPLIQRLPNAPSLGLEDELANARRLLEHRRNETGWDRCSIEPRQGKEDGGTRVSFLICWPNGDEAALADLVCDVFTGALTRMAGDEHRLERIAVELERVAQALPGESEATAAVSRLIGRCVQDARRLARDLHDLPALVEVLAKQAEAKST